MLIYVRLSRKVAKHNKGPRFDRIPYEFYKQSPDNLLVEIVRLLNLIFESCEVPTSVRKSIVYPLYKSGN